MVKANAIVIGSCVDAWMVWAAQTLTVLGYRTTLMFPRVVRGDIDHDDIVKYLDSFPPPYKVTDLTNANFEASDFKPLDILVWGPSGVGALSFLDQKLILARHSRRSAIILRRLPENKLRWLKQILRSNFRASLQTMEIAFIEDIDLRWLPFRCMQLRGSNKNRPSEFPADQNLEILAFLLELLSTRTGVPPQAKYLLDNTTNMVLTNHNALMHNNLLLNFQGMQKQPDIRGQIAESILQLLRRRHINLTFDLDDHQISPYAVWYATESAPSRRPEAYLNCTAATDFTLCLPGFAKFTHRTIEPALLGSIPTFNDSEISIYHMGFQDGVNCISVKQQGAPSDWLRAVESCLNMARQDVQRLTEGIQALFHPWKRSGLRFEALARWAEQGHDYV